MEKIKFDGHELPGYLNLDIEHINIDHFTRLPGRKEISGLIQGDPKDTEKPLPLEVQERLLLSQAKSTLAGTIEGIINVDGVNIPTMFMASPISLLFNNDNKITSAKIISTGKVYLDVNSITFDELEKVHKYLSATQTRSNLHEDFS